MTSYGYGGGYSTTTYGAQGGADGGGFLANGFGGSQGGSQDSPGGSKSYAQETLRPVTIKQIIEAPPQSHPEAKFKIDGSDVSQLTFVAQVHSVIPQATNTTYKLDDGTGLVDIKQWVDRDAPPENAKPIYQDGQYLRVIGTIKDYNDKRHIGAHVLRPVTDFNEINYHLLEATVVHLYFTRGPPDAITGGATKGDGMFVDSMGGAANGAGAGKKLPAKISAVGRKVFSLLQSAPQNNEGLHVHHIAAQLGIPMGDVWKAGDELLGDGLIYTTVDDETWAVLEY